MLMHLVACVTTLGAVNCAPCDESDLASITVQVCVNAPSCSEDVLANSVHCVS